MTTAPTISGATPAPPLPWLGIVVASFALLATALRGADTVLPQVSARTGLQNTPEAPALQGRSHAATPAR